MTTTVLGNMTDKSDVGYMNYNNKNQLTSLNRNDGSNTNYTYDANGNQLTGSGRTIQWTSFNKAKLITQANASTQLSYDANHNRAIQTIRNDGVKIEDGEDKYWVKRGKWGGNFETKKRYIYVDNIETTYYSANGYEMVEEFKNNKTYKKFRINLTANGKQIGIYVKSLEGSSQEKAIDRLRYFHKDILDNIDLITDIDGKVVARQHYQAFGKRDQNLSDDVVIDEVKRGFTSHEHIDELGLINMNARLYDPETARFLSADSFIQDPNLTLSHNRYIYALNNPLKYTDPSGHFWNFIVGAIISYTASQSDNPFIRTLGMIVGGAMMGGAFGGETLFASTLHTKMAAGFVMGGINGGDAQGAILGAMSAGLTYGIGHGGTDALGVADGSSYFDSFVGTAVAHGTTQGLIAEVSGGSFQSGFAAGFSGHLAGAAGASFMGSGTDAGAVISRTTIAATMGGLVAQATGGNFQDGAYRAATVHLFNRLARSAANSYHRYNKMNGKVNYLGQSRAQQEYQKYLRREADMNHLRFNENFRNDPMTPRAREFHNILENLPDMRNENPLLVPIDAFENPVFQEPTMENTNFEWNWDDRGNLYKGFY